VRQPEALQKQVNELTAQVGELKAATAERDKRIDELRGEIALLRALQPKRSPPRKALGVHSNGADETQHVN
jgi:peptidoglycan hydrolase CwlO-like protein